MARTTSGTELVLDAGAYEARIVTVGAGLASLRHDGRDLVVPHDAASLPRAYQGKVLVPWPNRITDAAYTWRGVRHEVPVNERATGAALHGLMAWVDWRVVHADPDSATLGAFVAPREGYPWPLEVWATYALHGSTGLTVTLSATNIGSEPAPYGVSMHPFLSLDGAAVDTYELAVPASRVLEVDRRMAPVGLRDVAEVDLDFRTARVLGPRSIDHAFTGLPDLWSVTVRDPATRRGVALVSDAPWVQLYTGELLGRRGIAAEPMTCAPDAFNSGLGLVTLEPHASHTLSFSIRALPSS